MHNQWKPLTVFLSDPKIPIHNNASESALRIVALRVSKEGELEGLDLHEHGGTAYPELIGAVGKMETPTVAKGENVPIPIPALVD